MMQPHVVTRPRLLNQKQAAERLDTSVQTVRRLEREGRLQVLRLGTRCVKIREDVIDRILDHGL
jgi:excisionase family DNA binding protein